ncbi:hypothetical protein HDV06_000407 [Boothiomyces sp. JEL0866]|nr:hypothetical protein HDV06_000407 [Boothiomyces sp. JEL0866]
MTVGELKELINSKIKTTSGFKPYLNVEFDTLKLYFTAHGTKSQNLIINLNDDGFLTDDAQKLSDAGIDNETEISLFKRADYDVFKANPEIKWE